MLEIILESFYLMLPAYFANMAPVICRGIFDRLAFPLDFNKKFLGKPILGKNKTFRGVMSGLIFAIVISFIQNVLYNHELLKGISLLDYHQWLLIGLLLGAGALVGDAVKSFIKRRIGIPPGNSLAIFDQIDFVLGAIIFISFIKKLNFNFIITIVIISYILNVLVNSISYYLKIRTDRW